MESTAILVEAERKFMHKLCQAMIPPMIDAFYELYTKAVELSQGRQTLIRYQVLLQEIPHWNNTISKQHADAIIKSCAMFPNLLAAVFVISVKILSAVRISSESKKINIKLPSNDVFVHSCFIEAAMDIYKKPHVFADSKISDEEKREQLTHRFEPLIKKVVDGFIPIQQILDTYIPNFTGELDMGAGEDPADPEPMDAELEETPAPAPEETPTPAPEETPAPAPEETPAPAPLEATEDNPEPGRPPLPPPVKQVKVHHETLFDDAPDK